MNNNWGVDLPLLDELKNYSLRKAIRLYIQKSVDLKQYLDDHPDHWIRFQDHLNDIVDSVSREISHFEREYSSEEEKIYKLKRFFIRKLRKYFLHGHYITWSLKKPYGYAGDFQIIDDIYINKPTSSGFERLWDNYFLRMGPSIATRNRKEDFKRIIKRIVYGTKSKPVRIMDLGSGPCRDLKELIEEDRCIATNVIFDCYDFDEHAIAYAQKLLNNPANIHFYNKNALRMALKKDIRSEIKTRYDLIFSTGLFDYLDERVAVKLVANLKKLLKENGWLCVSNYREKAANPWAHLMEWVAEWNLIYRSEDELIKIFTDAGFNKSDLTLNYEPLKIMQYCLARNSSSLI